MKTSLAAINKEEVHDPFILKKFFEMNKCENCAKTFDRNWILQRNKREVHEWESQFQCGKSEKKFKRKSHLDRHEQTCCRCQRCNTQFDSFQEKKNNACTPPKKVRIVENERAEPVQSPGVKLRTEPSPAQPQPIEVEKNRLIPSGASVGNVKKNLKENPTLTVINKFAVVARDVTHNLIRSRKKRTMHAIRLKSPNCRERARRTGSVSRR